MQFWLSLNFFVMHPPHTASIITCSPEPELLEYFRQMLKPLTIHIKTFGCQMNAHDSTRMQSTLLKEGFVVEPELTRADVLLINTCSVRDKAEQKVLSLLGELKALKAMNPSRVIGVTGCVGQRMGRVLLQKNPHVDIVMGPDGIDRISDIVKTVVTQGKRVLDVTHDNEPRKYTQPFVERAVKASEFVTVMKGCDHFCTYCIVPFVRGREKSRSIPEIINDVTRLVDLGAREVTFLGQNINTFGKGTTEKLSKLIDDANKIAGLRRIRYVTAHPKDLGDDLIRQFGCVDKLMPLLHLPFQSASDSVLKRMSRLYTRREYMITIEKLRKARPDIALSTDVIVGFPGESEADFSETLSLLKEVEFSVAFLFKYSPRPGTRAFSYQDTVSQPETEGRLFRAQQVAYSIIEKENKKLIGDMVPVLIEALDKKKRHLSGRTAYGKIVHVVDATADCIGQVVNVQIVEANVSNLKGAICQNLPMKN